MDLFEAVVAQRSVASTLFHFLNWTLHHRQICDNMLLPHEGACPELISDMARQAIEIYAEAVAGLE